MNTEIKNAINAVNNSAQYDESAKRLLGNKEILAYILINTIDEFNGMNPKDVANLIEKGPFIGQVPIEPGLTNGNETLSETQKNGQPIIGMNTENAEIQEGLIRFDIVFYVRMKDGLSQVIVNVEIQKNIPGTYDILNRAIFYVSRLISSQKERDFVNTNYDDIKRVFSIWVCLNTSENSMSYVHLTKEDLLGSYNWKGNLDLINIVLISIAKELPESNEKYELHRLLGTLLSDSLASEERLHIIEAEYNISREDIRKEVTTMCNLSEGILEKGIEKGIEKGREDTLIDIVMSMHKKGYSVYQIVEITAMSIDEVEAIINNMCV